MRFRCRRKARAISASPGFFRFLRTTALVVCVCAHDAYSQDSASVRRILIVGAKTVPATTISSWMESQPGGSFRESDISRIDSGYAEEGFPLGKVDSVRFSPAEDRSSHDVLVYVREGKPAIFSELRIEGDAFIAANKVLSEIPSQIGAAFSTKIVEGVIRALLLKLESAGYPAAKVRVKELNFVEDTVTLEAHITLSVDSGPLARLAEILIEGNTATRSSVIHQASGFEPGDIYTEELAARIQRRLERLRLFSNVSLPRLVFSADRKPGLSVKVIEGNTNRFDGMIGYVPGVSGSSGFLTGFADVQFGNILGTGRRLAARWNRESQTTQEVTLRYREPWIASLPVSAEAGYVQRKQDSTFVREVFDGSVETSFADDFTAGISIAGTRVIPSDGFGKTIISTSSSVSVGGLVAYDTRNDQLIPSGGFKYQAEYHTGVKDVTSPASRASKERSSTQRLTFDLEWYYSPMRAQVVAVRVFARDFRSSTLESSDLFRLGGATTLRGYREGQFVGSRVAWINLEYRYMAAGRSFLFAFSDAGYASVPSRSDVGLSGEEVRRIGYGVGANVETPLGIMGLSLAFGQGDTFSTAKFHLRLINEF